MGEKHLSNQTTDGRNDKQSKDGNLKTNWSPGIAFDSRSSQNETSRIMERIGFKAQILFHKKKHEMPCNLSLYVQEKR